MALLFFLTPPKILSIPFFIKQRIILHRPVPLDPFPVTILRPEIIPVPIRGHISGEIKHRDLRSLVHPVTVIRGRLRIIKQLFKPLFVKVKSFAPRQAETLPDGSNLQYFCRIGDRKKHSDLILYLTVMVFRYSQHSCRRSSGR